LHKKAFGAEKAGDKFAQLRIIIDDQGANGGRVRAWMNLMLNGIEARKDVPRCLS
jgi:hypothetical protein